ncbi:restriction endonuclease [Microbacterium sp.]|uniref:restriction endonuclease n=1 Tax=Microbacterium sp. TaxID=51671 RepID=UPI002810A56D|nr:restriction endonuclease [Microbacterium sp.]
MGFETTLQVANRAAINWRKQTSDMPRLLFRFDELLVQADGGQVESLRFESTAEAVLETLETNGFGWHSVVTAYGQVRTGWHAEAFISGGYTGQFWGKHHRNPTDDEVEAHLVALGRDATPESDLIALGQLLSKQWAASGPVLMLDDLSWDEPVDVATSSLHQAVSAADVVGVSSLQCARAAVSLGLLFREARLVAWPLLISVLLKHIPRDSRIAYDLSGGITEWSITDETSAIDFARDYWETAGAGIAGYAEKIGTLVGSLAGFRSGLGRTYEFSKASAALARLEELNAKRDTANKKARGDSLEALIEALVAVEGDALRLVEKNFRTAEEEIDLVLANSLARPFWTSFVSPLMLVECKNWTKALGVKDLRVFESKLSDRKGIARIGVFVSMSGFTRPFMVRLKTIQSSGTGVIFAVGGDDVRSMVSDRVKLTDWLETHGIRKALGS